MFVYATNHGQFSTSNVVFVTVFIHGNGLNVIVFKD